MAAGLGERDICQLLMANAKQFALSKDTTGYPPSTRGQDIPDLARTLLGIESKDDHYRIEISLPHRISPCTGTAHLLNRQNLHGPE